MIELPIKESVKFGWNKFWERPWFFVGSFLIIDIFNYNYQSRSTDPNFHIELGLVLVLVVIGVLISIIRTVIAMGENRLLLNAYENTASASFKDLWTTHPFWRFVGTQVLYGLIVLGGFILLIVPGIIWSLKYMFATVIVIDRGLKPMEALRESARITYGHKWRLFLFGLVLAGVNILGALCLIVGLLVSVPVSALAIIYAYRFLERQVSELTTTSA